MSSFICLFVDTAQELSVSVCFAGSMAPEKQDMPGLDFTGDGVPKSRVLGLPVSLAPPSHGDRYIPHHAPGGPRLWGCPRCPPPSCPCTGPSQHSWGLWDPYLGSASLLGAERGSDASGS